MSRWATGVAVVAADGPCAMTVNAFLSVSLNPPLLLVSIGRISATHERIAATGRFALSILAERQAALSMRFAQATEHPDELLRGVEWTASPSGLPWIDGALAHFDCAVQQQVSAQDHTLFLARVTAQHEGTPRNPLVYFGSQYRTLDDESAS